MVDIVSSRIFSSGGGNISSTLEGRLKVDAAITSGSEANPAYQMFLKTFPLTLVDTEYSMDLQDNCQGFEFRNRGTAAIRYAFVPGKVATPTEYYAVLPANWAYESPSNMDLTGFTLYFATSTLGQVMQVVTWS